MTNVILWGVFIRSQNPYNYLWDENCHSKGGVCSGYRLIGQQDS